MTIDLWMLLSCAAFTWALIMFVATGRLLGNGFGWGLGNHEATPELHGWLARAKRASDNMNENLPLFAVVVAVVHLAGKADPTSALWSQVYLLARIAHAAVYIAGITVIRTAVYLLSIAALVMMASVLL